MRKSLKVNALLLAMLLAAETAGAAGLGRLSVMSALGQPLKAEIELLSVQPEELGSLSVKLASSEMFRQARLDRAEALSHVRFNIEQRAGGQAVLRISSAFPVSDPFLDLLIELNWSSGRILREYTILLDPPSEPVSASDEAATAAPAVTQAKVVPGATGPGTKPAAQQGRASAKPTEPKSGTPSGKASEEPKRTYGPVKSGETLHSVAEKVLYPNVGIEMMMASLYEANKKAFSRDNINLLKRGQTLAVPEQEVVMRMFSPKQAQDLIRNHGKAWNDYRNQVAEMATKSAEPTPVAKKDGSAGKIVAGTAKDKITPPPAPGPDVLKLSKGQPPVDAKGQQRVQAMQEELAAKGRSLKEANDRVAQLEKTVKDMQRLIQLKDQPKAQKPPQPAPEATKPPVHPAPPKPETAKPAPAPVKVAPPPMVIDEPSFLGSLLEKPLYIGGALAAILLGALAWVMLGRRRHRNMTQLEQSVLESGDDFKTAIFRTTAGASTQATVAQNSVMTDFSRLGLGAIDTHEVDPIAEAEVYMAYGRDAQAEEILKEALNKDPSRHEIALKLLEIYATRRDTVAFETLASEIYASLAGKATPLWVKVADLGRSIDPDNPLYQLKDEGNAFPMPPEPERYQLNADMQSELEAADVKAGAEELGMAEEVTVDESAGTGMDSLFLKEPTSKLAGESVKPDEDDLDGVIDFQIDMDAFKPSQSAPAPAPVEKISAQASPAPSAQVGEPPRSESVPMELDLDMGDFMPEPRPPEPRPVAQAAPAGLESNAAPDIEFDMPEVSSAANLPDLDFSGIDLELSEPMASAQIVEEIEATAVPQAEPALDSGAIDPEVWEEVNTKLDLAKAYIEMGDKEGAREILEEVLKEGDPRQQAEAGEMITASG